MLKRGLETIRTEAPKLFLAGDHVMHTDELEVCDIEVGDSFGSDHLPLRAGLAWFRQQFAHASIR